MKTFGQDGIFLLDLTRRTLQLLFVLSILLFEHVVEIGGVLEPLLPLEFRLQMLYLLLYTLIRERLRRQQVALLANLILRLFELKSVLLRVCAQLLNELHVVDRLSFVRVACHVQLGNLLLEYANRLAQ
jgi:hypothetical protein